MPIRVGMMETDRYVLFWRKVAQPLLAIIAGQIVCPPVDTWPNLPKVSALINDCFTCLSDLDRGLASFGKQCMTYFSCNLSGVMCH